MDPMNVNNKIYATYASDQKPKVTSPFSSFNGAGKAAAFATLQPDGAYEGRLPPEALALSQIPTDDATSKAAEAVNSVDRAYRGRAGGTIVLSDRFSSMTTDRRQALSQLASPGQPKTHTSFTKHA